MKFTLSYSPAAELDLAESLRFYRERGEGLGNRLFQEVNDATETIIHAPFSFPVLSKNARKKSLKKFPFTIIFTVDEEKFQIVVIAIWHARRNPEVILKRT